MGTANSNSLDATSSMALAFFGGGINAVGADDVIVGICATDAGTYDSVDSSFTIATSTQGGANNEGIGLVYRILNTTGLYNPTLTMSGATRMRSVIQTFKGTPAGGFGKFFEMFN